MIIMESYMFCFLFLFIYFYFIFFLGLGLKIEYHSKVDSLKNKFDLIFANSVLCVWPENTGEYTFETFEETLKIIDDLLNVEGILCIYNSKYLFTETIIFHQNYEII